MLTKLTIGVRTEPAGTVLTVAGEVDLGTSPRLRHAITAALATDPKCLTLDLAGVTFCDSIGLSALIAGRKDADSRDVEYRVLNPRGMVASVLAVTGVLDYLNMAADMSSEAVPATGGGLSGRDRHSAT